MGTRTGYVRVVMLWCMAATIAACAAALLQPAQPAQAARDTTPPEVVKLRPAPGATGVDRDRNVLVTFSEKMDASTLNRKTVMLFLEGDPVCPNPVSCGYPSVRAKVSYNATTDSATLNPLDRLPRNTAIVVYVEGASDLNDLAVADLAGNKMVSNYQTYFVTGRT